MFGKKWDDGQKKDQCAGHLQAAPRTDGYPGVQNTSDRQPLSVILRFEKGELFYAICTICGSLG